jgi:hypothetical protein
MKAKCEKRVVKGKSWMVAGLILAVWAFCADAGTYTYDDFNGPAIDLTKWTVTGTPGLFTESGGRLHFDGTMDGSSLVSKSPFGAGFFSVEFYDFASTNLEPPGSHRGSFAALGLGDPSNFVRIIRDQNGAWNPATGKFDLVGGVFEVNYMEGGNLQVHYIETGVAQGQLGMFYDGTTVTFYYNPTLDPDSGWQSTGWKTAGHPGENWSGQWTPGWTSNPTLFLRGYDIAATTSFSLDNVKYTAVPEPPVLLFLGLGMVGIAGWRRRNIRLFSQTGG